MSVAEQERTKYHRMWTEVPGYRDHSPGEALAMFFVTTVPVLPGDTVIDLGCGPGRASAELHRAGLNVTLLDITEACLDWQVRKLNLPFIEACLWRLPELPKYDWLYCCDVLEHIPTIKVDKVLNAMQAITGKGAFMQIALFPEAYGRKIGETLHLTVESPEWWQEKLERRWKVQKYHLNDGRLVAITGGVR